MRGVIGLAILAFAPPGCASDSGSLSDDERIVRATLRLIALPDRPVCVDRTTSGDPLVVYANMLNGPVEVRRKLGWSPPQPLRPPVQSAHPPLGRPEAAPPLFGPVAASGHLPRLEQSRLDANARDMSHRAPDGPVSISPRWIEPGVRARYWMINQVDRGCAPRFRLSRSVQARGMAFITVTADHWGVTYALTRLGDDWRPVAQWDRWLY